MHAGDRTPDPLPEPVYLSTGIPGPQVSTVRNVIEFPDGRASRHRMLVCNGDAKQRKTEVSALQERGLAVVSSDPMAEYSFNAFESLLSEAAAVRFNCSVINNNVFKHLLHICDYRQRHGLKPFLVGTGVEENEFKHRLGNVLKFDRFVGNSERNVLGTSALDLGRWGIEIVHRWWIGETLCMPGEEVYMVRVFGNLQAENVSLGMKDRVALDQIVRCQNPQNASQWTATLNANQWVKSHGARAPGVRNQRCTFSRTAFRECIYRIRHRLSSSFAKIGVKLDPMQTIECVSCATEQQYFWNRNILVIWDHVEC